MWARWVLSFAVAAALLVALVLFVNAHNTDSLASQSPAALARANREAEIVVAQDQQPHVLRLRSAVPPRAALVAVVRADINGRIESGGIDGTLQRVSCLNRGSRAGSLGFACVATVDNVNYRFAGVVDAPARQLVYCRRDVPPVPSQPIPLSPRCEV